MKLILKLREAEPGSNHVHKCISKLQGSMPPEIQFTALNNMNAVIVVAPDSVNVDSLIGQIRNTCEDVAQIVSDAVVRLLNADSGASP